MNRKNEADEEMQHHHSYLFTVRLWLEDLGDGRTECRGKAQHISSGETCYFREWSVLQTFFLKLLLSINERDMKSIDGGSGGSTTSNHV